MAYDERTVILQPGIGDMTLQLAMLDSAKGGPVLDNYFSLFKSFLHISLEVMPPVEYVRQFESPAHIGQGRQREVHASVWMNNSGWVFRHGFLDVENRGQLFIINLYQVPGAMSRLMLQYVAITEVS